MSSVVYVFRSLLDCVMFDTDDKINYVNCIWSFESLYCLAAPSAESGGELISVQLAGHCKIDAVYECGFTATLLIIHGGHVRQK